MAAESPDEADDSRSNPYSNSHIVAYCLWRFFMLICQQSNAGIPNMKYGLAVSLYSGVQNVSVPVYGNP